MMCSSVPAASRVLRGSGIAPVAHRSEEELDELGAIPDQHGHALARAHAEPRQHARDLIHPLVELPVGGATLPAPEQVDDRNLVGYAGGGLVEEKAEIAPAIQIVHVTHARLAAVRADMRASDIAAAKLAVTRRARLPSYRLQFQAPARGCDEKVTHGANVPSRRDS